MARGGISLSFVADVASFLKGTDDVRESLEDVVDSLSDVSDEARTTSSTTGTELDSIATEGKTAASDLETDFRRAFDQMDDDSRKAGDNVSRNVKRGTTDGIDSTAEFKQEAAANIAEAASSFEGDLTSAFDVVQSTMGGLTAALPVVGAAVTAAAAVGLGAIRGMYEKAAERRKQFKENTEKAIGELYQGLIDGQGKLDKAFMESKITEWIGSLTTEETDALTKSAERLGLTLADLAKAQAGDEVALKKYNDAVKAGAELQQTWAQAAIERSHIADGAVQVDEQALNTAKEYGDAVTTVTTKLGDQSLALQAAKDKADAAQEAIKTLGETEEALPTTIEQDVSVDTSKADGDLKAWQKVPRFVDINLNPVIDEWVVQNRINKVKAQADRLLS